MSADDVQFTEEEIKKVNEIIANIQSDLKNAIEAISNNDFDKALEYINSGMKKTNCTLCQKKLKLLNADVTYTKNICDLDTDLCIAKKDAVKEIAIDLKDDFIPMANTKKAIRDKKTSTELDKVTHKPPVPFPLPHELLHSLFPNMR